MTRVCEHCFGEIKGEWISDMPKPGQGWENVPYWHLDVKECQLAGFGIMADQQKRDGS